ncbi:hypothetical protein Salat_0648600 [Sesamum alatum]|uniref:Myb/SANT-like domain-containing protein n=1 Tax=Sesamum alatum TaxID=300844 RepID=A0AAE1YRJ6_9LAMI|nr:hypothetical protein Salat_0648600 [Sesamum alatum]
MEKTFVHSLVEHARSGFFHPERVNIHAVMCALYDLSKEHGMKVAYEWAQTRVAHLRERYELFKWVVYTDGVIWNPRLGFLTAPDQGNKRVKCYVNAYEDLWEALCIFFDHDNQERNYVIDVDCFDLNVRTQPEGWVVQWTRLDTYYDTDCDADSVLPIPRVPRAAVPIEKLVAASPRIQKSRGASSSTASNTTPIEKDA